MVNKHLPYMLTNMINALYNNDVKNGHYAHVEDPASFKKKLKNKCIDKLNQQQWRCYISWIVMSWSNIDNYACISIERTNSDPKQPQMAT